MITELHIQGFRRFENYSLRNLRPVNLLVGENNSGKTTVLEAVHFLTAGSGHGALRDFAYRRGEVQYLRNLADSTWSAFPSISGFLHGHSLQIGSGFSVSSADRHCSATIDSTASNTYLPRSSFATPLVCNVEMSAGPATESFGVGPDGVFDSTTFGTGVDEEGDLPSYFLDHEMNSLSLRKMWDRIVQQNREPEVIAAMRLLLPDFQRVYFAGVPVPPPNPRVRVLVDDGEGTLRSIGSFGEGVFRVLQLAIALTHCKAGCCLIDEIDTGLHYSVLGEVWQLVIETAKRNSTQVFVTTHSQDCLRALAQVCDDESGLASEVSVQKVDHQLPEAINLPGDQLPFAMLQEIELR